MPASGSKGRERIRRRLQIGWVLQRRGIDALRRSVARSGYEVGHPERSAEHARSARPTRSPDLGDGPLPVEPVLGRPRGRAGRRGSVVGGQATATRAATHHERLLRGSRLDVARYRRPPGTARVQDERRDRFLSEVERTGQVAQALRVFANGRSRIRPARGSPGPAAGRQEPVLDQLQVGVERQGLVIDRGPRFDPRADHDAGHPESRSRSRRPRAASRGRRTRPSRPT